MKKVALIFLLTFLPSAYFAFPRPLQNQKQQQKLQKLQPGGKRAGDRPLPPRAIAETAVLDYYVKQFQQVAEISPEVFARILPFLEQFVADRFELSRRRTRALNQMRQIIARNGTDEELSRFTRELDSADAEFQSNQEKFLGSVDPLLTVRQRAKVRFLLNMVDNVIRQTLQSVQNPNQQRRN